MASTAVVLSSGPRIRTDELTSAAGVSNHVQFVKLMAPTAGTTAPITTANPLAVYLQGSTATVTVQGNASVALTSAGVGGSTANPLIVGTAPIVNQLMNSTTPLTPQFSSINVTVTGIVQIVASGVGAVLVHSVELGCGTSCNIQWVEGASNSASNLTGLRPLPANGNYVLPFSPVGWFKTASGNRLNLSVQGATGPVAGSLVYSRPAS